MDRDTLDLQQLLTFKGVVGRIGNGIKDTAVSGANAVAHTATNVYNGGLEGAGKYITKNAQIAFEKAGETLATMTPAKAAKFSREDHCLLSIIMPSFTTSPSMEPLFLGRPLTQRPTT